MKKIFALIIAFAITLSLCACGQGDTNATTSPTSENTSDSTTTPAKTEDNVAELAVAVTDGAFSEYSISDGNVYLIDISNPDGTLVNEWSVSIKVGNDYKINKLKYIGCCNGYLESVDAEVKCELLNSILTVHGTPQESAWDDSSLYLVLVSDGLTEGEKVSFSIQSEDSSAEAELRTIRGMTGEVVYSDRITNYSNGLSWCVLTYADTQKHVAAIVDKQGTILAEIRNDEYISHGDFYNGVSLVEDCNEVLKFVNKNGEVQFASNNPAYEGKIKGIYPGGYIFLERTDANLTSSATYYAIMDCYENFVIDWTEYGDYRFFDYLGDDVFAFIDLSAFLDGIDQKDNVNTKFYNAESKKWTAVNNIDGDSLWNLPDLVAEGADGWITLQSDGKGVLVSTKDGKIQTLANPNFGVIADNKVVTFRKTNTNAINMIKVEELGYVLLDHQEYKSINYEYIDLIQVPKRVLSQWQTPGGSLPSYNIGNTTTIMMETDVYDAQFSNDVMLLSLKGVDGHDYYALMNTSGENVIDPVKGVAVSTLGYGKFLVERDGEHYILDESGHEVEILSDKDYGTILNAEIYNDSLAWVETSRYVNAFIDIDGNYVLGKDDVLNKITTIGVSSLTISVESVNNDITVNVTEPVEDSGIPKDTSASAFEYEYGYVEIKLPEGGYDTLDAVIITKYVGNDDVVMIPAEIDGIPILAIAESAFAGTHIRELYFAGNLAEIHALAFAHCTELTTVVLPDNWMRLGKECFTGCKSLKELRLPANCSFFAEEVWNDKLGVYEYVMTSPIAESDSTLIVTP